MDPITQLEVSLNHESKLDIALPDMSKKETAHPISSQVIHLPQFHSRLNGKNSSYIADVVCQNKSRELVCIKKKVRQTKNKKSSQDTQFKKKRGTPPRSMLSKKTPAYYISKQRISRSESSQLSRDNINQQHDSFMGEDALTRMVLKNEEVLQRHSTSFTETVLRRFR